VTVAVLFGVLQAQFTYLFSYLRVPFACCQFIGVAGVALPLFLRQAHTLLSAGRTLHMRSLLCIQTNQATNPLARKQADTRDELMTERASWCVYITLYL